MQVSFIKQDCSHAYLKVIEAITDETKTFCSNYQQETNFRALNNITISYYHSGNGDWYRRSSFNLRYTKGKDFSLAIIFDKTFVIKKMN